MRGVSVTPKLLVAIALAAVGIPERQQVTQFVELPGHCKQGCRALAKALVGHIEVTFRGLEEHPEVVADHIGRNLPAAHRATDEGSHEVLGVIEHELVARTGRNRCECQERVGPVPGTIPRQLRKRPAIVEKKLANPGELAIAQRIGDVRLVDDHIVDRPQPVEELGARVIVRPTTGNYIDRRTRWAA